MRTGCTNTCNKDIKMDVNTTCKMKARTIDKFSDYSSH